MKVAFALEGLTHSFLERSLTSIVWTYDTFVNNFAIKYELEKYFKESFSLMSDSYFSSNVS